MDTGKDFVEKIEELVNAARTVNVGGQEYITGKCPGLSVL